MSDDNKVVEMALVRPEPEPEPEGDPNAWLIDWWASVQASLEGVEVEQVCLVAITPDGVAPMFPAAEPGVSPFAMMGALHAAVDMYFQFASEAAEPGE